MKRGRIRNLASYGLVGVSSLFGARCGAGPVLPINIPVSPGDIRETYVADIAPPPRGDSDYAVKLYIVKNNLNSPDNILGTTDGNYTTFECSKDNPLEVVVGFEQEFRGVMIEWISRWSSWHVEGGAATPVILAGFSAGDTMRFVLDSDRKESGPATLTYGVPSDSIGIGTGSIFRIDTGYGSGRFFKIKAYPINKLSSDTKEKVYMDSLYMLN